MEYCFQAYFKGKNGVFMQLGVEEYYEGCFDWYSFEVLVFEWGSCDEVQEFQVWYLIFIEVDYFGMLVVWWWEMEDGKVNFLAMEVSVM